MEESRTHTQNDWWGRLKVFGGAVVLALVVTLALVIGNRLSDEALAVLAGAVCGVGAALPTSLLIVSVTRRREEQEHTSHMQPAMPQTTYPPVIVVAPSAQQRADAWNPLPTTLNAPLQRQFTVVGGSPSDGRTLN
ncbi:MAG TPA: hypothetical protein ENN99_00665 [Chloroflexi bacterium]|nr:hypothetical protein [Chloroflexota bacterium]